ncbi:DUF3099 domain-containing protein [Microbacterium sp. No. 7]|uniref:DUF3099 domain-containing protein n=1 Tax=Microbacterium sp. No. 7 TaxID=1714373 RepID=UPI0006D22283|nr:DUF3099 domain-containing protein [Microbacterium sp. No. 7]ALJ20709.1 hypothetical protein AOA12_12690 [Microbacterium sp. No. 7]
MRNTPAPQSATSLPRAPRDEAQSRMTKYFIMMTVRASCFVLMVAVTPYGWYTFLFAIGAIVLPYLAVVIANVGKNVRETAAVPPERQLAAPAPTAAVPADTGPTVIQVHEKRPPSAS